MTQTSTSTQSSSSSNLPTTINDDGNIELNEYLKKLIELVPYLKNIQNGQENITQKLENFQYLNINNETQLNATTTTSQANEHEISDLQILQSALDYILDLQEEIYMNDSNSEN
jgi:hypothetical protein